MLENGKRLFATANVNLNFNIKKRGLHDCLNFTSKVRQRTCNVKSMYSKLDVTRGSLIYIPLSLIDNLKHDVVLILVLPTHSLFDLELHLNHYHLKFLFLLLQQQRQPKLWVRFLSQWFLYLWMASQKTIFNLCWSNIIVSAKVHKCY